MLPALSSVSSITVCENTEIKVALAALGNCKSVEFQNKDWVCAWPAPGVQAADRLDSQRESEVRQMEGSRGSERLAEGPPGILLLERHRPQQSGNLLSSQASSLESDEICYQGRTCLTVRNPAMTVSTRTLQ